MAFLQSTTRPKLACSSTSAAKYRNRPLVVMNGSMTYECSTRVKGDAWRVSGFVSDFGNLPKWFPGVSAAYCLNAGSPVTKGTQFKVQQTVAGFKITSTYEVLEIIPEKKIVYACSSELHNATEQLIFMPDPNDKEMFTFVRYMSSMQLTEWRRALQPVISGQVGKLSEDALQNLTRLLSSSNTPLASIPPKVKPKQKPSSPFSSFSSMSGDDGDASSSGNAWGKFASFASAAGAATSKAAGAGLFGGMFGSKDGQASTVTAKEDVLGYYKLLGLKASSRSVTEEDVRTAFRKAAQTMHPDKLDPSASSVQKAEAETKFRRIQVAYKVLRDAEARARYDMGEPVDPEASTEGSDS